MRFRTIMVSSMLVLALGGTAFAGGLLQKLPKDGTWVKYTVVRTSTGAVERESSGEITMKLVGTIVENGERYRWVEMESVAKVRGKSLKIVMKWLIREKDLKPGAKSAINVLRGWKRLPNGDVVELTERDKSAQGLAFLTFSRIKNPKSVKAEKSVDYQKGRLKIAAAMTGELDGNWPGKLPPKARHVMTRTIWQHKSVPFGAAVLETKRQFLLEKKFASSSTTTLTVQDFGTGSKSALPDKR